MSSQFFGLYIAQSGLNAFQAAVNTTANNVSNVETDGYSRQKVELKATSSLRAFQKYGNVSTGVSPEEIVQIRDKYYDIKYWQNQSSYGYHDTKLYYMTQIEDYYTDSKATEGFTTIFTSMFNSMDTLKSNPSDTSVRAQFVNDAEKLSRYFNNTSTLLSDLQTAINDEIKAQVDDINSIASKIATLNKQINTVEVNYSNANELRDERALLIDKLSEIVTVEVTEEKVKDPNFPEHETGLTIYNVKVNGQPLVSTGDYFKLAVEPRPAEDRNNLNDVDGLYDIRWENTGNRFNVTGYNNTGRLRALVEMRDGNDALNIQGNIVYQATDHDGNPIKDINGNEYATDSKHLILESLNYTDPDKINFPPAGNVTIRGVDYSYESFDVVLDPEGKINSIVFNLAGSITEEQRAAAMGSRAQVGDVIDCKGIPYYQNEMATFLRSFSRAFNDIEHEAEDLYGNHADSFFIARDGMTGQELKFHSDIYEKDYDPADATTYILNSKEDTYFKLTASSIYVNSNIHNDLRLLGTAKYRDDEQGVDDSTIIDRMKLLERDVVLYRSGGANAFLETIYSDVTVDTRESTMFQEYYTNIQKSIDKQRRSVSGVDEDEEAQNLVKFQNAYNLSSKVISVLAEMYDQLILNTM